MKKWRKSRGYFFLNPAGHLGLMAVTFLVVFPFTQEIVTFFLATVAVAIGVSVGVGEGVATTSFSCDNLTLIVGEEKVNPLADK